jgi:hypothetical protein
LTSKREILTTTTLFRRIKHAYDKQEELVFHREAFLTPPLFTQLCRKFRSRELPVAMLDVLLIREFGVEEINAQSVAKAFIEGARMVGVLNENNIVADIDQLAAQQPPRRELASPPPSGNIFRQAPSPHIPPASADDEDGSDDLGVDEENIAPETALPPSTTPPRPTTSSRLPLPASRPAPTATTDAIAHLFGLQAASATAVAPNTPARPTPSTINPAPEPVAVSTVDAVLKSNTTDSFMPAASVGPSATTTSAELLFRIQLAGPGINTQLDVVDADDLSLVRALLDKIERRLKAK